MTGTGIPVPPSPEQQLVVCLPAGCTRPLRLAGALAEALHGLTTYARLCPHHLPLPDPLPHRHAPLVVDDRPAASGLRTAAAAPAGLLDPDRHRRAVADHTRTLHAEWSAVVAGTDPAEPLSTFIDRYLADPDPHSALQPHLEGFAGQPRIAAMAAADATGAMRFTAEDYGPALTAYQHGPDRLAAYLADALLFGDMLLDLDGSILAVGFPPRPRYAQTLADRETFHTAARAAWQRLDPHTVLATVHVPL